MSSINRIIRSSYRAHRTKGLPRCRSLRLESLEDRRLLAIFDVDSTLDSVDANPGDGYAEDAYGKTTLRAALMEANALAGADTINIPAGTYSLTLSGSLENYAASGDLDIRSDVNLNGAGAASTIIDATGLNDRVFDIWGNVAVGLRGVTVTGGNVNAAFPEDAGGGLRIDFYSTVTLERSVLKGNSVSTAGTDQYAAGGAIHSLARLLTILDSDILDNSTTNAGGAIYAGGTVGGQPGKTVIRNSTLSGNSAWTGGAIFNHNILEIENSTLSGNSADPNYQGSAGAINNNGGADATLTNVTVSGNTAYSAGAISNAEKMHIVNSTIAQNSATYWGGLDTYGTLSLENTIIANNTGASAPNVSGTVTSLGHNLIGNTTGSSGFGATGDLLNVDPQLASLADNGGRTRTHALLPGSPAIDAANTAAAPGTDQRGVTRPQGAAADIGAFEFQPSSLQLSIAADSIAENAGLGATTATVTRLNMDNSQSLVVNLASSDTTEAAVPTSVTIPAGQSSFTFPIDAVDDLLLDGQQHVTITASTAISGSLILEKNIPLEFYLRDVAVQSDGKIIAAGFVNGSSPNYSDFAIARFTADGQLDSTFGGTGIVFTDITGEHDQLSAVALQSDGKIVAAGTGFNGPQFDFILARYNVDGSLDSTFGSGGKLIADMGDGSYNEIQDLAIQPDGKLLVGGNITLETGVDFAVVRFNSNGTLDSSFGNSGRAITSLGLGDYGRSMALQPDGKILLVGVVSGGNASSKFGLVRYTAEGALDTTFSYDGKVTTDIPGDYEGALGVAVGPEGKIAVVGQVSVTGDPSSDNLAWALYDGGGTLIQTVVSDLGGNYDAGRAVVFLPDGKLLVGGTGGATPGARLLRYSADGALETQVVHSASSYAPTVSSISVQSDGRVVIGGYEIYGTKGFVARYQFGDLLSASDTLEVLDDEVANRAPTANDDSYTINEDDFLGVVAPGLLANDTDPDGDLLTVNTTPVTPPSHALYFVLRTDGSFSYRPAYNYYGSDSFVYEISDGQGHTDTATVTITINSVNDSPFTGKDLFFAEEDTALVVSANSIVTDQKHLERSTEFNVSETATKWQQQAVSWVTGRLTAVDVYIAPDTEPGAVLDFYVNKGPAWQSDAADFSAQVTITADMVGWTTIDVSSAAIDLTAGDYFTFGAVGSGGKPVFLSACREDMAGRNTYYGGELWKNGQRLTSLSQTYDLRFRTYMQPAEKAGVLANDHDVEGSPLTSVLVSQPSHGAVTLNSDGTLTYTPQADFHGTDSFTYQASDGALNSDPTTVTIEVAPVNDPPVAQNDAYQVDEDQTLVVAAVGVSRLTMVSEPGDYIGGGKSYDFDQSTGTFTAKRNYDNGISIHYQSKDPLGPYWYLDFAAPGNAQIVPGVYTGAMRFPFQASFRPGLNVSGEGRGANYLTGQFTVRQVTYGLSGEVLQFDASFEQHAEDEEPALFGRIRFNSSLGQGVLLNDSDADQDALTAALVTGPTNGELKLNADGSVTYTPNANFNGTDSFTYQASDGTAASNVATVTITVDPVNDAPVATNDSYSTDEDTPLTVTTPGVLGNDSDVDGDMLTAALVSGPSSGTLTLNTDGSFSYTPNANFHGSDSFTYQANDGTAASNVATVTITVNPVNDAPVAADDSASTDEDTPVTIDVLANDSDVDGDSLTAALVSGPSSGTLTLNADGSFSYTPNANFHGKDSFTYKANDGTLDSNTATVTITVNPVNDAPVAKDDSASTDEDTPVMIDVLANDSDVDGNPLTVSSVTDPAHGTATINTDGTVTYAPDANFNGSDSFTYTLSDGDGGTDTATVTITVGSVNDAPVATDDSASTDEDTLVTIDVLANDSDVDGNPLTVSSVTDPAHGTATINTDGMVTYAPDANFHGTDSFTYTLSDGDGGTDTATVTITVNPVNDAPAATDDSYSTSEDTVLTVTIPGVLGNDSDVDGDSLTAVLVVGPSSGTLTLNADGSFSYTPNANFHGTDSFTYALSDGQGGTDTATVTITVGSVNDGLVAADDSASTNEDTLVTIDVLANDSDVDGNPLTVSSVTDPAHGTATINTDGTVTYAPNANFNGSDSFSYTLSDGQGGTDTATVTITVNPVNDAPVAADDSYSTDEDTPLTVTAPGILGNDSDADGDSLTAVLVVGPSSGTLTLNADGSFSYTPNANFHGTDSFTYALSDGQGGTDTATVTITVGSVNDAPVATDDSYSTSEDTVLTVTIPGVLGNDSDADGDSLTAVLVAGPSNGTLTLNTDGSFSYTPNADFSGTDSFTYQANDGTAASNVATVTITVAAVNDAPVATDDSYTTNEDTALVVAAPGVLTNDSDVDGDPLTAVVVAGPSSGTLTLNADGSFTYTPNANFHGSDSFGYTLSDGDGGTDTATVTITVNPVNDAPVAADDSASTNEDTPVMIDVLANDSDVDGDPLTAVVVAGPSSGTLTLNADGSFSYTPNADFYGSDSFTYRANDGTLDSDIATVMITVHPASGDTHVFEGTKKNDHMIVDVTGLRGTVWVDAKEGNDHVLVLGTPADTIELLIFAGPGNDHVMIAATNVRYEVFLGDGNDHFWIDPALENVSGTVDGGDGNDRIYGIRASKFPLEGFPSDAGIVLTSLVERGNGASNVRGAGNAVVFDGGTGENSAELTGSRGDDTATLHPSGGTLTGDGFRIELLSTAEVTVQAGEGTDVAILIGTNGNDRFVADPLQGTLSGSGFSLAAVGFDFLHGMAKRGDDTAELRGSEKVDEAVVRTLYTQIASPDFFVRARGFDEVTADAAGGESDVLYLFDGSGDDLLSVDPTETTFTGSGITAAGVGFDIVHAASRAGGHDKVSFFDGPGADKLVVTPRYGYLVGEGYFYRANRFEEFSASGAAAGDNVAWMYDSRKDDTFTTDVAASVFSGPGFQNTVLAFNSVYAIANSGGRDVAHLHDSPSVNLLLAKPTHSKLFGPGYYRHAEGFDYLYAHSADGQDLAELTDSPWDDLLQANTSSVKMKSNNTYIDYYYEAIGFKSITAKSTGGNGRKEVDPDVTNLTLTGLWE